MYSTIVVNSGWFYVLQKNCCPEIIEELVRDCIRLFEKH